MLKLKIFNYFDKELLTIENFDKYDIVLIANNYESEFKIAKNTIMIEDENVKHKILDINDYILSCHDAYNGVSDLNLHNYK